MSEPHNSPQDGNPACHLPPVQPPIIKPPSPPPPPPPRHPAPPVMQVPPPPVSRQVPPSLPPPPSVKTDLAQSRPTPQPYNRATLRRIFWASGILIFLAVGGIQGIKLLNPPEKSMQALQAAVKRHDRDTIIKYLDADSVAPSLRDSLNSCIQMIRPPAPKPGEDNDSSSQFANLVGVAISKTLATKMVDVFVTPKNLVDLLSGKPVTDILKEQVNQFTKEEMDPWLKDASPKTKAIGALGEIGIPLLMDGMIDMAASAPQPPGNKNDSGTQDFRYTVSYVFTAPDAPIFVCVYKRHGLTVWRLSEIRALPHGALD